MALWVFLGLFFIQITYYFDAFGLPGTKIRFHVSEFGPHKNCSLIPTANCPPHKHWYTNCSSPCPYARCLSQPLACCAAEYCGGCVARFYYKTEEVHCETDNVICELKSRTLECDEPGYVIKIKKANYGRTSKTVCRHPYGLESLHNNTKCISKNSLTIVKQKCDGKSVCTLLADNDVFGEPCFGVYKYLEVDFECVKGHTNTSGHNRILMSILATIISLSLALA